MTYILTVDDDADVQRTLRSTLQYEGYEVDAAYNGAEALQKIAHRRPDAVLLDIMMPLMDGMEVCRQLRADDRYYDLPILFLTGNKELDDIVAGLDAGADDYIVKPFELAELNARVRALLRRAARNANSNILELGPVRLDSDTYQVMVEDQVIQLTRTEHMLLRYMMEHANQALSPYRLLEAVWDYPPRAGDPDLVRAHIRNLRAKIEVVPSAHDFIRTIHGVGYMVAV